MSRGLESLSLELARRIHTVLAMHFLEGKKQSEISVLLSISTATVNRLIKQGRELGMVQISIDSPFQRLFDLEHALIARWSLESALVTPAVTDNPNTTLGQVGAAAGNLLLETVRDGDTIAISGGKAVRAMIENLPADQSLDVNVVPMTGGGTGPALHRRQPCRHAAGREARRAGHAHPRTRCSPRPRKRGTC